MVHAAAHDRRSNRAATAHGMSVLSASRRANNIAQQLAHNPFSLQPGFDAATLEMTPVPLLPIPVEGYSLSAGAPHLSDLGAFDSLVIVGDVFGDAVPEPFRSALEDAARVDKSATSGDGVTFVPCSAAPGGRLVIAGTGSVAREWHDCRVYGDAAAAGVQRATAAGSTTPALLTICSQADSRPVTFGETISVALLGVLASQYVPLEVRESRAAAAATASSPSSSSSSFTVLKSLGFICCSQTGEATARTVSAMAAGVSLARDIGGGDPERMTALRAADHCESVFSGSSCITVRSLRDFQHLNKEYPLLGAVARASVIVPRHAPAVVELEYCGEGPVETTLMLVGKGVVFDTGGADIKIQGGMKGMSRDKCGAAAFAGFFRALADLRPKGLKVVAKLGFVRNSVGEDAYVQDEIITSRAGQRVRVGNTDAEGRFVMADLLAQMGEMAAGEVNPHLMTCCTLTGHAINSYGPGYTAVVDSPAFSSSGLTPLAVDGGLAESLFASGARWGDPFEVSRVRKEDFDAAKGKSLYEDVLQTVGGGPRGHQFPVAFLIKAAGLDNLEVGGRKVVPRFTHLDIAGSAGMDMTKPPSGRPVVALVARFALTDKR